MLEVLLEDDLMQRAKEKGAKLRAGLKELQKQFEFIKMFLVRDYCSQLNWSKAVKLGKYFRQHEMHTHESLNWLKRRN